MSKSPIKKSQKKRRVDGVSNSPTSGAKGTSRRNLYWGLVIAGCVAIGLSVAGYLFWFSSPDSNQSTRAFGDVEATRSHELMLSSLKTVKRKAAKEHPYLGSAELTKIRALLVKAPSDASASRLCDLHFAAGVREARLGNLQVALEDLGKAYSLLDQTDFEIGKKNFITFQLAVIWFRKGETENCCITGGPESCIVPIGPGGVHRQREGSENAIRYLNEVLATNETSKFEVENANPNSASVVRLHLAAQWLLNVAHMTLGSYPQQVPEKYRVPVAAFQSTTQFPRFKNIANKLGLDTFDLCGGMICDDFNNDGLLDLVTSTWDPSGQLNYFENMGNGSFENRTEPANLIGILGGLNINQADFNNDGYLDIFVMRGGWLESAGKIPNSLLRNNGDGTFTDVTYASGLANQNYPTQVSQWWDVDRDGDLDLFVGNEHAEGAVQAPCQLFRNNGDETFTDIAKEAGVENLRFTKGASFGDFDNDGHVDLYLSNLRGENRLYHNQGDGTFLDVAAKLGVTKPHSSFPTWFFDYNNDGNLDLLVTSYTGMIDSLVSHHRGEDSFFEPSCLYRGNGKGGFDNVTEVAGLDVPMLSMGANFGDLNNDGFLDFYLGTGDPNYESLTPNLMFLNQDGRKFDDVTMAGGFGHLQKGHGVAFADLDNDGDLEVVEQMGGAFAGDKFGNVVFDNPGFGNNWIVLKLVGVTSNRSAIGARIEIQVGDGPTAKSIFRTVNSGGSFGANPLRQTIGIGDNGFIRRIKIRWPATQEIQVINDAQPNWSFEVVEGKGMKAINPKRVRWKKMAAGEN